MTVIDRAMSVTTDVDPSGRVTVGTAAVAAEAAIRRLDQSPGTLFYSEDDYGQSLVELIGRNLSARQIEALLESELIKDERILGIEVDVTQDSQAGSYSIDINAVSETGQFNLTFSVDKLKSELVRKEVSGV